jgi:L-methionine (R)-S-oxide reductase
VAEYASGVQTPRSAFPLRRKISPSALPLAVRRAAGGDAHLPIREVQTRPSLLQIDSILSRLSGRAALGEVCRFLRHEVPHYRWVGVYLVDGSDLRLAAWSGSQPTEHATIPLSRGVCGRAARENRTVIVDDVREAPEYLACFRETRAEIVVPIREGSRAIGEIDIDGNEVRAYDATDDRFLTAVAEKLVPAVHAAAAEVAGGAPPWRGGG